MPTIPPSAGRWKAALRNPALHPGRRFRRHPRARRRRALVAASQSGKSRPVFGKAGAPLVLRKGNPADILSALIDETGAGSVYWNDSFDPAMNARDGDIRTALTGRGITVESFNATLLFDPSAIRSKAGTPFKVFTPFWRTLSSGPEPERPLPAPATIPGRCGKPPKRSSFKLRSAANPARLGRRHPRKLDSGRSRRRRATS